MDSLDWLLVAGVVAFYLQDAAVLLHHDEFVVVDGGRRWEGAVGGIEWSGRFLWVPNPLAPHRAVFRGAWGDDRPGAGDAADVARLAAFVRALRPVGAACVLLGGALAVALPLLLWRYPHPLALLGLLAVVYATIGGSLLWLWCRRGHIGLSRRACAWLAFECLACPPHAINLVRKLTLRHGPPGAPGVGLRALAPGNREHMAQAMLQRQALFGNAP